MCVVLHERRRGRSLGLVERARIQLASEVRAPVVGDSINTVSNILEKACISEDSTAGVDMRARESYSRILSYFHRGSRAFLVEKFKYPVVGTDHPIGRKAYSHDARLLQETVKHCLKLSEDARKSFLAEYGLTISNSGGTVGTRTTRGPVRSNHEQKRTGVVPPARDGSVEARTMLYENRNTENSIECSCPRESWRVRRTRGRCGRVSTDTVTSPSDATVPVELSFEVERDGGLVERETTVHVPDPHRAGSDNLVAIGFEILKDERYPTARFGTGRVIDG